MPLPWEIPTFWNVGWFPWHFRMLSEQISWFPFSKAFLFVLGMYWPSAFSSCWLMISRRFQRHNEGVHSSPSGLLLCTYYYNHLYDRCILGCLFPSALFYVAVEFKLDNQMVALTNGAVSSIPSTIPSSFDIIRSNVLSVWLPRYGGSLI